MSWMLRSLLTEEQQAMDTGNCQWTMCSSHIHTPSTSGDSSALLQAFELALAGVLCLALHEVIIVVLASRADEV